MAVAGTIRRVVANALVLAVFPVFFSQPLLAASLPAVEADFWRAIC